MQKRPFPLHKRCEGVYITVNDGVLTIRIVLNVSELVENLMQGDGASVGKFFNIIEEGKEIVSVISAVSMW